MKQKFLLILFLAAALSFSANAWAQRGPTPDDITVNPQAIGESGVAWYTTWETGAAEAKRSNRPIFFMSAATTCSGVSGVF